MLLVIYCITVIGKVTQLCWSEVTQDSSVLFLGPLFFLDLCYASSDAGSFFPREKPSFIGCFFQFYFFIVLVITDYYTFIVMAFDQEAGIPSPPHLVRLITKYPAVSASLWLLLLIYTALQAVCIDQPNSTIPGTRWDQPLLLRGPYVS